MSKIYSHRVTCPVCGGLLDTLYTPGPELSGMTAAMLLSEARGDHEAESPKCGEDPRWSQGWNIAAPVAVEETDV